MNSEFMRALAKSRLSSLGEEFGRGLPKVRLEARGDLCLLICLTVISMCKIAPIGDASP